MDLLTHICSGAAAATVVAASSGYKPGKRFLIVAAGAFAGALPDIDAISLWSGFDATFGHLFGLAQSGPIIYGGKLWYSHHGFFHSLAAALLIAVLFWAAGYIFARINKPVGIAKYTEDRRPVAIAFILGYIVHLLGDLPTPASVWDGIRMFWPWEEYVGGAGEIWWWNNYDIFLLMLLAALVNMALLFILRPDARRKAVRIVAMLAFAVALMQIYARRYDYAYKGNTPHYAEMEQHSKEEQRRILGTGLYRAMEWLDNKIPLKF